MEKRSRLVISLAGGFVVCLAELLAGCVSMPDRPSIVIAPGPTPTAIAPISAPPAGQYLFIEIRTVVEGSGNLPQILVDFPDYLFNSKTGVLASYRGADLLKLRPDEWGFVGLAYWRSGAAGGGASTTLKPIVSLPFSRTIALLSGVQPNGEEQMRLAPVEVMAVAGDGSASLRIDGQPVLLAPRQTWTYERDADVASARYSGRYHVVSSVTNYGWLDRELIR